MSLKTLGYYNADTGVGQDGTYRSGNTRGEKLRIPAYGSFRKQMGSRERKMFPGKRCGDTSQESEQKGQLLGVCRAPRDVKPGKRTSQEIHERNRGEQEEARDKECFLDFLES